MFIIINFQGNPKSFEGPIKAYENDVIKKHATNEIFFDNFPNILGYVKAKMR